MEYVVASLLTMVIVAVAVAVSAYVVLRGKKAQRYAVTLTHNEGAFVGLCTRKRYNTWTFVDVKVMPTNPGGAVVQAASGDLYVPTRNILYYQEIANVAE